MEPQEKAFWLHFLLCQEAGLGGGSLVSSVIGLSYLFCKIGLNKQHCFLHPTTVLQKHCFLLCCSLPLMQLESPLQNNFQQMVCTLSGWCPGIGSVIL